MSNKVRNIIVLFIVCCVVITAVLSRHYNYSNNSKTLVDETSEVSKVDSIEYETESESYEIINSETELIKPYETDLYESESTGKDTLCEIKYFENSTVDIEITNKDNKNKYISIYKSIFKLSNDGSYVSDDGASLTFINDEEFQIHLDNYPDGEQYCYTFGKL